MFYKVEKVYPLDDYNLLVQFHDGISKIYDVKPLFEWKDIFKALKDNDLFQKVRVGEDKLGVVWNDDLDLSAEELWDNGKEVK